MSSYGINQFKDMLLDHQPTGRLGKPEDFAGLVLFLSGYGGAHLTGNVIEIDGGSTRSGWRTKTKQTKL
jgi:NAD(P)-dependent dehydrogenase (short-subunit alcohol dehydrogenase family)